MKKVFIPSYGGGHANIMKLLYPELKNRFDVEILALTLADDVYTKANIPHKTIKDYLSIFTEEDQKNILDHGQELAKTEYNPQSSMQYEDCVVYLGMGMIDLVHKLASIEKAETEFKLYGRKAFCPVNIAKKILQHVRPDIVILSVNVRFEAAVGIAANELNIPVLFIQDLPGFYTLPFRADVCVMNDYTKQIYTKANQKNVENIFVTGQPAFDISRVCLDEGLDQIRTVLPVTSYQKIVVYLDEGLIPNMQVAEELVFQEAQKQNDVLFVMKLHPNMDFSCGVQKLKDNFYKVRDMNLYALLGVADVAIVRDSTSGLQAAFMDVDLMVMNCIPDKPLMLDYSNFNIAAKANNREEFASLLRDLLWGSDIKQQLQEGRKSFKNITDSARNISEVIKSIV